MNINQSLLRSALAIAKRKGKDTNWEAFEANLTKALLDLQGLPQDVDEQTLLRATCTPLTYRLPS